MGFLIGLRAELFDNLPIVVGLAVGGVIAAPFAAWLVSRVNPALPGTAVGGVIVLTNSQKLVEYFDVQAPWSTAIYAAIVVAWAAFVFLAWKLSQAAAFPPAGLESDVVESARKGETVDDARLRTGADEPIGSSGCQSPT